MKKIVQCVMPSPGAKEYVILRTEAADIYIPVGEAQAVARAIIAVLEERGHQKLDGALCICKKKPMTIVSRAQDSLARELARRLRGIVVESVLASSTDRITIDTAATMLESMSTLFDRQTELLEKYKRST